MPRFTAGRVGGVRDGTIPRALAACVLIGLLLYAWSADYLRTPVLTAVPAGQSGAPECPTSQPNQPVQGYRFNLTDEQVRKGVVSFGSTARARRAVAKLLRGEPTM